MKNNDYPKLFNELLDIIQKSGGELEVSNDSKIVKLIKDFTLKDEYVARYFELCNLLHIKTIEETL